MDNTLGPRRTALILEDNHSLLALLETVLSSAGFDTTTSDRGELAIDALGQSPFDVLVADVSLPDMNGLDVCAFARQRYQDKIVILVITGDEIRPRRLAALGLYADDFLDKPFNVDELVARLASKLRRVPVE